MALHEIRDRFNDNILVTQYWDDETDTLTVECEDYSHPGRSRTIRDIPKDDADISFVHPYGYAPLAAREPVAA